jgi:N-acyl homoserine lactone hydrolase
MPARRFTRRDILGIGGLLIASGGTWAAIGTNNSRKTAQTVLETKPQPAVSMTTASGLRVHGLQTGWIAIKQSHYQLTDPEPLRIARIFTDTRWTQPLPMLSWVIEHPEGLIVIDTGERAGANDLETYVTCADPISRTFLSKNFRINVQPEMELGPQLRQLGLEPIDVRWVVQTHLHFDHANGFAFTPKAEVLISRAELEGQRRAPIGAISCLYPSNFNPRALDYGSVSFGPFAQHHALTKAGDVLIVPTPGHSYGHQSVVLLDHNRSYLFAGDVVFDERQLRQHELAGIVNDIDQSRTSLETVREYITKNPTVLLPSHDPASLARLASQQITRIEKRPT